MPKPAMGVVCFSLATPEERKQVALMYDILSRDLLRTGWSLVTLGTEYENVIVFASKDGATFREEGPIAAVALVRLWNVLLGEGLLQDIGE